MPVATPPKIIRPFAANAAPGYIAAIPETTADPERASYDLGFPPLTMTPVIAGGKPPWGQDVNGILYACTANAAYLSAGQLYRFDPVVAAAIGGYARGCMLGSTDGSAVWFNLTQGNLTDPDGANTGWVSMFTYGYGYVPLTGLAGDVILLPSQHRCRVIVLTGTLGANITLRFPTTLQQWLVVNATNGAFSVNAAALDGSLNVPIPPGDWGGPVGVYSNGSNLYPTVAPLGVAIDQAPSPLSLVQRTNAGYVNAVYFNQTSPYENPAISGVWFEAASDGYHRKMTAANFAAQMFATFAPDALRQPNGYLKLPGGMLLQWGSQTFGDLSSGAYANTRSITFPTPFLFGNPFIVMASATGDATGGTAFGRGISQSGFQLVMEEYAGRSQGSNCGAMWFALGIG